MAISRRELLTAMVAMTVLAALPLPLHAAEDPSAGTPDAFLASIYDRYRTDGEWVDYSDPDEIRDLFTPELAALILADQDKAEAAGEVPSLDSDPFIDAQDGEISDLVVAATETAPGRATGIATFRNTGTLVRIELRLVRTAAGWRVDDILWPEGSLRGIYAR